MKNEFWLVIELNDDIDLNSCNRDKYNGSDSDISEPLFAHLPKSLWIDLWRKAVVHQFLMKVKFKIELMFNSCVQSTNNSPKNLKNRYFYIHLDSDQNNHCARKFWKLIKACFGIRSPKNEKIQYLLWGGFLKNCICIFLRYIWNGRKQSIPD